MTENAAWVPLSLLDFFILGMVGTFQFVALIVCVHLVRWRKWPPYLTKNVDVVIISTFAGILWTATKAIEVGFVRRRVGDVLAACDLERFLSWSPLCVHTAAFFIRVYRMWRFLIKHDDKMWRTENQIVFLSGISLIPVVATWLIPGTAVFDERSNSCSTNEASMYPTLGMNALGLYAICYLWFVCIRRLKSVRRQFNEYQTMKKTLLCLTVALLSYALVVVVLLAGQHVIVRRVAIVYPVITTYILLWGSIREPFTKKITGDDEYLWGYTKGFSELPSPAQLKASLAEQLSVEQLRDEFRRYIRTKVAQELVDFYLDSLDREEVAGFFERQAITMRIVERYIREDAPEQVNISEECRERILATDVTAYDIFDEARAEVLAVLETNFQRDFVTTEGFRRIADASELEHREMKLLRAGGMLPSGSATPETPVSPLPRSRLWGALKALPLGRRFYSPAVGGSSSLAPAPRPAPASPAEVMEAAAADAAAPSGDGGKKAAAAQPPPPPPPPPPPVSSSASSSAQVTMGAVLRTGVVMEEGGVGDGFTTPVAGPRGSGPSDLRGSLGFPTPARSDGYTPDSEGGSSEATHGVGAPVVGESGFVTPAQGGSVEESGFVTPAQGGSVDGFKTPL